MSASYKPHDELDPFAPRPPYGYANIKVSPSQILLPLTISSKCGQSFRWRGVKVWDPIHPAKAPKAGLAQVKEEGIPMDTPGNSEFWKDDTEWSFCLSDRVILLRQDQQRGFLYYRTLLPPSGSSVTIDQVEQETQLWLKDYLNLDVPLEALYQEWAEKDKVFSRFADRFTGVRMLRQDPWECLCSFICSSNNNIARITQMVQNLCTHFSQPLLSHTYPPCPIASSVSENRNDPEVKPISMTIDYYPFPSSQVLAQDGVEEKLRELGFGYRAKYIAQTAKMLSVTHQRTDTMLEESKWDYGIKKEDDDGLVPLSLKIELVSQPLKKKRKRTPISPKNTFPTSVAESAEEESVQSANGQHSVRSYLESLRRLSYQDARKHLLQFPGVGPKVADCVLLMSLDQPASIPVDTHVYQFAERWYHIKTKKYDDIAQKLRDLWGEYAGWAHSVLFTADLRSFANYNAVAKKEDGELPMTLGSIKKDPASALEPSLAMPLTHSLVQRRKIVKVDQEADMKKEEAIIDTVNSVIVSNRCSEPNSMAERIKLRSRTKRKN